MDLRAKKESKVHQDPQEREEFLDRRVQRATLELLDSLDQQVMLL